MELIKTLTFLILLLNLNLSAQHIDPSTLPDVSDYTAVRGNFNADTIILALHGGPSPQLYQGTFEYLEGISTFSVVEVMKQEMLTEVLSNENLTLEEGVAVNDTTVALIEKAVQHYNAQNKTVVLVGASWGAILLGEYLDDYGVDNIHRIIPMEGRLNMPLEFVDYLLDGYLPTFEDDGYTLVLNQQGIWDQGLLTLGAAAFANRWIDSLANLDLSKMMYTYAERDMQTGALLPEETDFLNNSGAQTLFIPNGSHGDSNLDFYQAMVVEFIRSNIAVDVKESYALFTDLKLFPSLAKYDIQVEVPEKGLFTIANLMGQVVYQEAQLSGTKRIDISGLSQGHYFAIFQSDSKKISKAKFHVVR